MALALKLPHWIKKGKAEFLQGGEYHNLERRIRKIADPKIGCVFYYAFDSSTRVGPFIGPDIYMPNCGIRTVGAAVYQAGIKNTRVVFGPWNPNFDASYMKLNNEVPQIFGVGSMQINEADAHEKIEQVNALKESRPLIIGGGPHANYQAWDFFNRDPIKSIDVAVRGEINVTLSLLEAILESKSEKETILDGFKRARNSGALNKIPGLLYISDDREVLIDTGKATQIADFDELPLEIIGLSLLEPRHNNKELSTSPTPLNKLRKQGARIISMITSAGCNFRCPYCPIPEMHQYSERAKSPDRMVFDIKQILENVGQVSIFGSDDNSFAFKEGYLVELFTKMSKAKANGKSFSNVLFYGTEATEHQADLYRHLFPLMRSGGLRAIWFGIEDLTAELVKKGQTPEKTIRLFNKMIENGISPMPMMMHFDGQPLKTNSSLEGILDQVEFLRNHGAQSIQVTYNTPSIGSKDYFEHFERGKVLEQIGDLKVGWKFFDGNHVISTIHDDILDRQKHLMACYEKFYNLKNSIIALFDYIKARTSGNRFVKDISDVALTLQLYGRKGMRISKKNLKQWLENLETKIYKFTNQVPESQIPIMGVS